MRVDGMLAEYRGAQNCQKNFRTGKGKAMSPDYFFMAGDKNDGLRAHTKTSLVSQQLVVRLRFQ